MIWQILGWALLAYAAGAFVAGVAELADEEPWYIRPFAGLLGLAFLAVVLGGFGGVLFGLAQLATGEWVPF